MTTTHYVIWKKSYDQTFRSFYRALAGESIQSQPQSNKDEDSFMVGSSRLTDSMVEELQSKAEFQDIYIGQEIPASWEPQEAETQEF